MTRLEDRGPAHPRRWLLSFQPLEARIVTDLPDRVTRVLADPNQNRAVIDRLFPPSYSDAKEEAENRRLLGASLYEERRALLDDIRACLRDGRTKTDGLHLELGRHEMDLWLRFINDLRLLLATELGIDTNIDHSAIDWEHADAPKFALLEYLGGLEYLLVEALTVGDGGTGTEEDEDEGDLPDDGYVPDAGDPQHDAGGPDDVGGPDDAGGPDDVGDLPDDGDIPDEGDPPHDAGGQR